MTLLSPPPASPSAPGRLRSGLILGVILTAQLMVVLDATIVNVALPYIQRSLHFSTGSLTWVLNAYILVFGGLLLLGARAGDLFGRRRVFLGGIALFTVGSLLGGVAPTGWLLLTARGVQGVGAAFAAPTALSLLMTAFSEGHARVRAIGLFTAVSAAGGAIGLVVGGALTQFADWRWVMFVNVPIGLAVVTLGRRVLTESDRRHGTFDLLGAVLCTLGVGGVVFGLVEAGNAGWSRPVTVVSLVVGVILVVVFVRHEARTAEPILPVSLLRSPTRNAANVARALLYAGFFGLFFFLTQLLQDAHGYSPLVTGLAFVPMPTSLFLASQLSSRRLVGRVSTKRVMIVGTLLVITGLLIASRIGATTPYTMILLPLVLIGFGSGLTFVALTSVSVSGVDPNMAGAASGLVNVSQQVGGATGLAVLATAFDALSHHQRLALDSAHTAVLAHATDGVIRLSAVLSVAALALIVAVVREPRAPRTADDRELMELVALEAID